MSNGQGFLGDSVGRVIIRLLVLSLVVGFIMSYFNVTPWDLVAFIRQTFQKLWNSGLDALKDIGNWILIGAVVVVPIFLLTRVFARK